MISKNETIVTTYYKDGTAVGVTTKHNANNLYFFYEFVDNDFKKLGKGNSPSELEEKYDVNKRMGVSIE